MKMIYVEDDFTTSEAMVGILEHYKIKVYPFFSAVAFHENGKVDGIDLILTDGNLKGNESCLDVLTTQRLYYPETQLWLYSGSKDFIRIFDHCGYKTYEKPTDMQKLLHDLKVYNAQVKEKKNV